MRLLNTALVFLSLLFVSGPLASETRKLSGSDAPEFSAAVSAWLNGEDLTALKSLAQLSREGNSAAQILLASIASRRNMIAHVTSDLPRKDRIALLRIPTGLSGKSWLTEAQNEEPLAAALLQVNRVGEEAPAIASLIEFGEPRTALLAAESMLYQGQARELIDVLQGLDDQLPEEAEFLLTWALTQAADPVVRRYGGSARIPRSYFRINRIDISNIVWAPPETKDFFEDKAIRDAVVRLSGKVDSWTPIRQFCDRNCASSVGTCTALGANMMIQGPFPLSSPLESVIPNTLYWGSPRIEGDLARAVRDMSAAGRHLSEVDACFVGAMEATQTQHGYLR